MDEIIKAGLIVEILRVQLEQAKSALDTVQAELDGALDNLATAIEEQA